MPTKEIKPIKEIHSICFLIFCISTIITVILAMFAIWGASPPSKTLMKLLVSSVVFVLASALTLSVIRALSGKGQSEP